MRTAFSVIVLALLVSTAPAQAYRFSVSVDGEQVAGDKTDVAQDRKTDVELAKTDIQLRYDGLDVRPMLNILPVDLRSSYKADETVKLLVSSNYPGFIARTEVRIFADGVLVETLPAAPNDMVNWTMPAEGDGAFTYLVRVYDGEGRFDETAPLSLRRTRRDDAAEAARETIAAGWGEDRAAKRTIPLSGGAVTIFGRDVAANASIEAMGEVIPVDADGSFVVQRILPAGQHEIAIAVVEPAGETLKFRRDIAIPDSDWFYVAMADLTLGATSPSARIEPAASGEFSQTYAKGQAQFYLKGKIRGEYLLTASGDTGEGPLEDMLVGVLSKDPRAVLSRIDPNDYYPVYGDDSELVDDAPTRGKLHVRLERGNSRVMWGTFRTEISNSAFVSDDRVLYGAAATYKSEAVTASGEHRATVTAHAAHPGTQSQRDMLRGSGGSAYFLHRQDIAPESETLTIEVRDGISGVVKSRQTLTKGTDYRINYMQGVVILTTPLASSRNSQSVAGGHADTQFIVAQYQYAPAASTVETYAVAGAAQVWLNDHVAIGATAVRDDHDGQQTELIGANARVQLDENTFVRGEVMRSQGQGASSWVSIDGGLTFVEESLAPTTLPAYAARIEAQADLAHIGLDGSVGASVEQRQAGFAAAGSGSKYDQLLISTFADIAVSESVILRGRYDLAEQRGSGHSAEITGEVDYALNPDTVISLGLHHLDTSSIRETGQRTDAGLRVTQTVSDDLEISAFARKTLNRSGAIDLADRAGVGIDYQVSDAVAMQGELSYGATGVGGMVGVVHTPNADERNYIGYRVNTDDTNSARNGLVIGSERRYNEVVALHSEAIYNTFAKNQTLTQSYGVALTPDDLWTINGAFERGNIFASDGQDIQRTAISLGTGYVSDGVTGSVRGEFRDEISADGSRSGQSMLLASSLSWRTNDDWRLLMSADGVVSNYDNKALLDGDYVEASIGYAYRPVNNERLNALARYTFLYDLPAGDQVTANGRTNGPAQRSHILSVDANYDLNDWLTLGAKYAFRIGEVSASRSVEDFTASSAHLAIVRLDAEVLDDWDILLEGRVMALPEAQSYDLGALAAVYRSVGDNVKIGAGYNFAGYSDDLRDLSRDYQGVFVNVIAKY